MNIAPLGGDLWGGRGSPEGKVELPTGRRFKDLDTGDIYTKGPGATPKTGWTAQRGATGSKGAKGDKGDKGDPGDGGAPGEPGEAGAAPFDFVQNTEAAEWIMNHNLNTRPVVALMDLAGNEMDGEVAHVSLNQTRARFSAPLTGRARLF